MADTVKDPVCGMESDPAQAAATEVTATEVHEGQTLYFCSRACHETFTKDPHRYGHSPMEHGGHEGHGHQKADGGENPRRAEPDAPGRLQLAAANQRPRRGPIGRADPNEKHKKGRTLSVNVDDMVEQANDSHVLREVLATPASPCDRAAQSTIYAPPEHAPGTIHRTRAEADAAEAEHAR